MEVWSWIGTHWSEIIQTLGVAGLFFTAHSLRIDAKVRRVTNRLTITQHHRELWIYFYSRPAFQRVLQEDVDLQQEPVTSEEEHFVILAVLHLSGAWKASTEGMYPSPDGLKLDMEQFFSLPVVNKVWERIKPLQDRDFVAFIESSLR